ncbi:unnamed protein product [Cladocopium goreaui]|uniref:Uncharacterized protein n=1 Tax=Cladocopium goreaui TaxID=2562237 RepID=A0A9P1BR60_9DINO|nr:unnamed protein product [Cladocopium goreaui]
MEDAPLFCNGDCTWTGTACAEKAMQPADKDESSGVSCGSHRAADCSQCPQGHGDGWCHGDCLWLHEACVLATPEHRAAAEKEHQKLQSIPRLRSFQRLGADCRPRWQLGSPGGNGVFPCQEGHRKIFTSRDKPRASLMANDLFVALLQKLRSFPLDWRNDEVNARRLDALGKEVRLSDLYAACPSLRKRVASHGGLGRLWVASHQWAVDSEAAEVQLPRATQNIDMSQETMWLQLVADMRKFPLSWNAHLHKDLRGALLGRQLHLAQRFARSPGLRRRLDQEGGLCSLCEKVHKDSVQGQEAVEQTMPSQNYSHVAMPRHTPYTAGYGTMGSATALPAPSYGHFQSSGLISSIPSSYPSSSQENWAQWTEHVPSTRLQQPISRMERVTRSPPEPGLVTGDPSASSSSMQQPPAHVPDSLRWLDGDPEWWRL